MVSVILAFYLVSLSVFSNQSTKYSWFVICVWRQWQQCCFLKGCCVLALNVYMKVISSSSTLYGFEYSNCFRTCAKNVQCWFVLWSTSASAASVSWSFQVSRPVWRLRLRLAMAEDCRERSVQLLSASHPTPPHNSAFAKYELAELAVCAAFPRIKYASQITTMGTPDTIGCHATRMQRERRNFPVCRQMNDNRWGLLPAVSSHSFLVPRAPCLSINFYWTTYIAKTNSHRKNFSDHALPLPYK